MIEPIILFMGKKPVRAAILDGAVWFVASDLFKCFKRYTDRASLSSFKDDDLRQECIATDAGPRNLVLVSTLGALTIATLLRVQEPRILDAWVRREVRTLALANGLSPSLPMTLGSDGDFLVKPRQTAPHYFEWWSLKHETPRVTRAPIRPGLLVLQDDDDNLMPEAEHAELLARRARIEAMARAGGEISVTMATILNVDAGRK